MESTSTRLILEPDNPQFLATLSGQFNEHLKSISARLQVKIKNRGNVFQISGQKPATISACNVLKKLYVDIEQGLTLDPQALQLYLQQSNLESGFGSDSETHAELELNNDILHMAGDKVKSLPHIQTPKSSVTPRGQNQKAYVKSIRQHTINFGIGPAGTGKTYLAVACATEALKNKQVERILLVRPAVEAGEKLGFLPGDLTQKIDPYLRPLYDALYEMMGFETVSKLIEKHIIEIAPLAFMRGRTLNHAFIILDESQNTTSSQMKMFLTRIGAGSTAVITGDLTQTDLAADKTSGLMHAQQVLQNIEGISFTRFLSKDVVRHPLVQRIVEAYEDEFETAERLKKQYKKDQHRDSHNG